MRRLLMFDCAGAILGGSLDHAQGTTGILLVTGGSQTRVGSHRMYERLSKSLADKGYMCFRFDHRGVGDSEGEDPGFRGSGADIEAATAAFRRQCPQIGTLIGFGLCDGATALALSGRGLDGLILVNPWLVEAESGEPPSAAIRRHYARRLLSLEGWRKLLTGSLSFRRLAKGLGRIAAAQPSILAAEVAAALRGGPRAVPILARNDATAIAAAAQLKTANFRNLCANPIYIDTDSHTFAKPGDAEALLAACLEALRRL